MGWAMHDVRAVHAMRGRVIGTSGAGISKMAADEYSDHTGPPQLSGTPVLHSLRKYKKQ